MKTLLLKYSRHIPFFGLYLLILLICKSSDITFKCFGNDSISLLYISKYFEQRYPAPFYAILGYPITNWLPGNDAGNLVIWLSVIPAFLTSILIFAIIRKLSTDRWAPWIGTASFMGCNIIFSQAIIIEIYSLMAFLFTLSYMFLVYGKPRLSTFFSGLAISCHYMTGFIPYIVFMIVSKEYRRYWYIPIVTALAIFVPYYLFTPVFYWEALGNRSVYAVDLIRSIIISYSLGSIGNIGIGIWHSIQFMIVGFGLAIIPMFMIIRKNWKVAAPFTFMIFISIIWIAVVDYPSRYNDLVPFVPFAAIMMGLGISYIKIKYFGKAVFAFSIIMLLLMPINFDIGRTLDENPTTARQCITQLDAVDDGSLIVCLKLVPWDGGMMSDTTGGHVAPMVEYYNRENGRNLIPVNIQFVYDNVSCEGRDKLIGIGIILPDYSMAGDRKGTDPISTQEWYMEAMMSLVSLNPDKDVYYYKCINIEDEKYELVRLWTRRY